MSKKRKLIDECRGFQDKWTDDYFFVLRNEKPVCLICSETIAALKENNLKKKNTVPNIYECTKFSLMHVLVRLLYILMFGTVMSLQLYTFKAATVPEKMRHTGISFRNTK